MRALNVGAILPHDEIGSDPGALQAYAEGWCDSVGALADLVSSRAT